jgi:peptidoglycan hydrolase CwlO-like protein
MMKRGAMVLLAVVLIIVTSASAMAAGLNEKKDQLKDVNSDIKKTKEQLEQVRQEQSQVNTQLQTIEVQLDQKEKELKNIEQQLKDTQEELDITRKELEQAIEEAKNQEILMAERVRAMYINGVPSYLELLLEAKSLNEFLDRIVMVKRLISYDTQILEEMEEYKEQVDRKRAEFEEKEQTIIATRASIARQKEEIEQKKKERNALLAELKDQEESYEQDLEELERTSTNSLYKSLTIGGFPDDSTYTIILNGT